MAIGEQMVRAAALLAAAALGACGGGGGAAAPGVTTAALAAQAPTPPRWIATWTAPPQFPYPAGYGSGPIGPAAFTGLAASEQSFRMIVHVPIAGSALRVHFTNRFGAAPLAVDHATLAKRTSGGGIDPASLVSLQVGGASNWVVPAGGDTVTDGAALPLSGPADVAISFHVAGSGPALTWHAAANTTSYVTPPGSGDHSADTSASAYMYGVESWFYVNGIDSAGSAAGETVVCLGDSITDGVGSTLDGNDRWPDVFERRLRAAGKRSSVVNAGIAGNVVTREVSGPMSPSSYGGPAALDRFATDVVAQSGVSTVVLLEGINDLGGYGVSSDAVIAAQQQLIVRAHAAGLRIIGATLTPAGGAAFGAYATPAVERARTAVNAFVRSGAFDGVIDFDAAVRAASDATKLAAAYDSGDHLHLNAAGYAAMANAIDLRLFH